ncbi:MAG: HD domain-containing protein, partial [Patescibacteria group bacterium]
RDRLSHTLEMAQLARGLARGLGLNEDLSEAIALAHDLGHTPFGHAGEHTLSECMKKFDLHFEHNEQSKRIVEKLEDRYPDFPGLNVSWEVRDGLAKHQSHYDQSGKRISGKTLEAQVADLADEIAYHNHDLDDGLRSGIFEIKDLRKLKLFNKAEKMTIKQFGKKITTKYLRHRAIGILIGLMVRDVLTETERRIKKYRIRSVDDAMKCTAQIVSFSPSFKKKVSEIKDFLWNKMYQSPEVLRHSHRGQRILKKLFNRFMKNPGLLPQKLQIRLKKGLDPLPVIVKDYVAGMTDLYALSKM